MSLCKAAFRVNGGINKYNVVEIILAQAISEARGKAFARIFLVLFGLIFNLDCNFILGVREVIVRVKLCRAFHIEWKAVLLTGMAWVYGFLSI